MGRASRLPDKIRRGTHIGKTAEISFSCHGQCELLWHCVMLHYFQNCSLHELLSLVDSIGLLNKSPICGRSLVTCSMPLHVLDNVIAPVGMLYVVYVLEDIHIQYISIP